MSSEVNESQSTSNPITNTKAPNRASKRKQWSEESMVGAMQAVADGSSITGAAREHGVPRTTLQDRVLGNVIHGRNPGPKRYLNEAEEKKLSEFLVETAAVGYGKSRAEIMAIAEKWRYMHVHIYLIYSHSCLWRYILMLNDTAKSYC